MRYYIEQAQDRFYDPATLPAAKARARRLSRDRSVYLIAEKFDRELRDYAPVGQFIFNGGVMETTDGITTN